MAKETAIDWAEVYKSLNVDMLKQSGKWMLKATLVIGFIVVMVSFLALPGQPELGLFFTLAFLFITLQMQWRIIRLSRRPKVVVGVVTKRSTLSYRNRKTHTRTTRHFISIAACEAFEIDYLGKADPLPVSSKPGKYESPSSIYHSVKDNERLFAVILPHNNSIAQIFQTEEIPKS